MRSSTSTHAPLCWALSLSGFVRVSAPIPFNGYSTVSRGNVTTAAVIGSFASAGIVVNGVGDVALMRVASRKTVRSDIVSPCRALLVVRSSTTGPRTVSRPTPPFAVSYHTSHSNEQRSSLLTGPTTINATHQWGVADHLGEVVYKLQRGGRFRCGAALPGGIC